MMRIKQFLLGGCVATAMSIFAVPSRAATAHECASGQPIAASDTRNFHQEANYIFQEIQSDSRQAVDHATQLQSFEGEDVSWQAHAEQLSELKAEINDMGEKLCRLETIRTTVAPWQQKTIDQIGTNVRLMADNEQDAIAFVNSNQSNLWVPRYQTYLNNLVNESDALARSVGNAVEYSHVLHEYRGLRNGLGVKSSS
jgi:hypothetical protein